MIVLDTNVLSELLRPEPEEKVMSWFRKQSRSMMFTTAITRGEMLFGIRLLPDGQRKDKLHAKISEIFSVSLVGRVLDYDSDAADAFANIAAGRRAVGQPVSQADLMIAGIARSRGAALATRNVRDFESCGIELINPWR